MILFMYILVIGEIGGQIATNVSLSVSSPAFVHTVPKSILIQKIGGVKSTPITVKFYLYAMKTFLPTG